MSQPVQFELPRQATSKRILCYAPYNLWALHGMWEMTILNGLRQRGADVRYVLCDGLYTDCDMFRAAFEGGRPDNACELCQMQQADLTSKMLMPFQWLGRYLHPDDFREAFHWANSLEPLELLDAAYNGWPIAEWTRSSLHSHYRLSELDVSDPKVEQTARRYLHSGLVAAFGLSRLMDDYQPDALFIFNARMSSTQVALQIAMKKGIEVVGHERGFQYESLRLFRNGTCLSLAAYRQTWKEWGEVPLSGEELKTITEYVAGRQYGKNMHWASFSPPPQDHEVLREQLSLSADRPIWALFTSSDDEIVHDEDWASGPYEKQMDWILHTLKYIEQCPEIDLVIRVHPNTAGEKSCGKNLQQLREMQELSTHLPANARMVMPDDDISTYSLMDIATAGLLYHSTAGLEMACKGKPVAVAAGSYVTGMPFVRTVDKIEDYDSILKDIRKLPIGHMDKEIQRQAYRYAYCLFYRHNIPFPLVRMQARDAGQLNYSSLDDLLPGKDASLDHICEGILKGKPFAPPPNQKEIERSDQDERDWFEIEETESSINCPETTEKYIPADHIPGLTSIIVLSYNGLHHIKKCMRSIEECTGAPYELIVIDNGSTDGSRKYLRGIPGIKLIENPENVGAPAGRNQGIAIADGEYFVFLDNDTMVTDGWLERFIVFANSNPDYGLLGPMSNCVSGEQLVLQPGYTTYEELQAFGRDWALKFKGKGAVVHRLILFCLFARREVIQIIGGIDPIYGKWGFEDDDFCLRAMIAGYKCALAKEIFIHHTGGQKWMVDDVEMGGSQKSNVDYDDLMEENWSIFRKKWNVEWTPGEPMTYYVDVILKENPSQHVIPIPSRPELQNFLFTEAHTTAATIRDDEEPASIIWSAPLLEAGDDAQSARQTILGLDSQDIRIATHPVKMRSHPERILSHEYYRLEQLARQPLEERFVHIQEIEPQYFQSTSGALANIGRPSIGCDRLPDEWVTHCNGMDEIWVTSDSELEAFELSGVDRSRLHKIPTAIDLQQFTGNVQPFELCEERNFVFVSVLDWHPRSGWDTLFRAYMEEFGPDEDVGLLVHAIPPVGSNDHDIPHEIAEFLRNEMNLQHKKFPLFELYCQTPSLSFYQAGNAFVLPCRSNTHGRYSLESMASGLPIIATGWGGQTEFMTSKNSWELNYTMADIPKEITDQEPHLDGLRWAEPSVTHLRKLMREAFKHRRESRRKGAAARKRVAANHDRNKVAQQVNERLKEIFSRAGRQLVESESRNQEAGVRQQMANV